MSDLDVTIETNDRRPPASKLAEPGSQATAVEQARAIAEVRAAIMIAQQCPRDERIAWATMQQACGRLALAERAFYRVKNRGSGPTVHLARELARIWGNFEHGVRELNRDDNAERSEVMAFAWDQQTNVRSSRSFIVPHARMREGARVPLTDLQDIYLNNQNIGARAVRETILSCLPPDYVAEAQEICRTTIDRGDGRPLQDRINDMIAGFLAEFGVKVGMIESKIGRKRGQWTAADVGDLRIIFSSIRRGEIRAEDEFPQERVTVEEIMGTASPSTRHDRPLVDPTADAVATVAEWHGIDDGDELEDAPDGVGIPRDGA